jgi:hypothetical protein
MRKFFFSFCYFVFFQLSVFAQKMERIDTVIQKSLFYLVESQYVANTTTHFEGEWYSTMGLNMAFPLLGYSKDFEDSNCFTVCAVHNFLAEIYLSDTLAYRYLLPTIDAAFKAILKFEKNNSFNFWREYYDAAHNIYIRKPSSYTLRTPFINKAANVKNDADDTASAYAAMYYQHLIAPQKGKALPRLSPLLKSYIDKNRNNYHWYNMFNGIPRNSEAYMTWIGEEYQHQAVDFVTILKHTAFFWFPKTASFPRMGVSYIPYGTNDVDLGVNVNILTYFAMNKELENNEEARKAIDFIERFYQKKPAKKALIYYPNDYYWHYIMARAYQKGVIWKNATLKKMVADLKRKQQKDGSYKTLGRINDGDVIQSTAFAVAALIQIGEVEKWKTKENIEVGIAFLLSQMIEKEKECYWKGGVFFSGGTVVKNMLFFKSDAYTTALIVSLLKKYRALNLK